MPRFGRIQHVIVAGNHAQAVNYIQQQELAREDCLIATDVRRVLGRRGLKIHKTGTWRELPGELLNEIQLMELRDHAEAK